jgi:endonuclease/exonuclease/phosphatase family metal-dependent hydrolase
MGVLIAAYAIADPFYTTPEVDLDLPSPPPEGLRAMTLNMAHGRATKFHQNLTRNDHIRMNLDAVAEMIRSSECDVVMLQELDAPSAWSGRFDHLRYLSNATGLEYSFHGLHVDRDRPKLAYGTGVLSRYPIVGGESHAFDMNALDTKGYVITTVETPREEVDIVSLHLDFKRDGERMAQLEALSDALIERASTRPIIVAGDFNSTLAGTSGPLHRFVERHHLTAGDHGLPGTYPSHSPTKHIDYLLVSEHFEVERQWVLPTSVSDHRAVVVDLQTTEVAE